MDEQLKQNIENANSNSQFATMVTFADLMAILMSFFVLLYSLSEIDKSKFKLLGQSLGVAFGTLANNEILDNQALVDRLIQQNAQKYQLSPTPAQAFKKNDPTQVPDSKLGGTGPSLGADESPYAYTEKSATVFKYLFQDEMKSKVLNISQDQAKIMITVAVEQAYKPGSADLTPSISTTLKKLAQTLNGTPGKIIVMGHTDNAAISNSKFRSNWDLSAARAATLVSTFINDYHLEKGRFHLEAFADNENVAPNDSEPNRAKNRRIEIMIDQTDFYSANPVPLKVNPNAPEAPYKNDPEQDGL